MPRQFSLEQQKYHHCSVTKYEVGCKISQQFIYNRLHNQTFQINENRRTHRKSKNLIIKCFVFVNFNLPLIALMNFELSTISSKSFYINYSFSLYLF